MLRRGVFLLIMAFAIVSCQFTETMVMNQDGSGRMAIELDMSEMMAFGNMMPDTTITKMDTLISMKKFLEEHKDSIATLSASEQEKLKKIENINIHMTMDTELSSMFLDVYTDFKQIEEVDNLMNGLNQGSSFIPGIDNNTEEKGEDSPEIIGIKYTFNSGKFLRDSYILDEELHKQQIDSMKTAEAFMGNMMYKLKYTFPNKIIKSSIEDATYSLDGKTIEVERSFLDYMKDPDVLDLEVELEN